MRRDPTKIRKYPPPKFHRQEFSAKTHIHRAADSVPQISAYVTSDELRWIDQIAQQRTNGNRSSAIREAAKYYRLVLDTESNYEPAIDPDEVKLPETGDGIGTQITVYVTDDEFRWIDEIADLRTGGNRSAALRESIEYYLIALRSESRGPPTIDPDEADLEHSEDETRPALDDCFPTAIEFGSRVDATRWRMRHKWALDPQDDRRSKTVLLKTGCGEQVVNAAKEAANKSRLTTQGAKA